MQNSVKIGKRNRNASLSWSTLLLIQMMTSLRKKFKTWTQLLGKTWSWCKWSMPGLKLTCRKQQFHSALQELVRCPEPELQCPQNTTKKCYHGWHSSADACWWGWMQEPLVHMARPWWIIYLWNCREISTATNRAVVTLQESQGVRPSPSSQVADMSCMTTHWLHQLPTRGCR